MNLYDNLDTPERFLFTLCKNELGSYHKLKREGKITTKEYWEIWEEIKQKCKELFDVDISELENR